MFFDEDDDIEPKEALRAFYKKFAEEIVLYNQGQPVGFTMFKSNDTLFKQELPEYEPHLAITYSGVHPNYQEKGIWTAIRDTIYNIAEEREIPYILTAVDAENKVSLEANKSRGLVVTGKTKIVDGTETTNFLMRRVSSGLNGHH